MIPYKTQGQATHDKNGTIQLKEWQENVTVRISNVLVRGFVAGWVGLGVQYSTVSILFQ